MPLLTIGLNHKTAPLHLREQFATPSSNPENPLGMSSYQSALNQAIRQNTSITQGVILSTCNRLEFYTLVKSLDTGTAELIKLISEVNQVSADIFEPHLYYLHNKAAVNHLMQVAAGLNSMVVGEAQILGQVTEAYKLALSCKTTGPILSRLFEMAIHTGKRARAETGIGLNPASISSVAIQLANQHLGALNNKVVAVLGAGKMSLLALQALAKQPVKQVIIINRSKEHAEKLAEQWEATALTFNQLQAGLEQVDLVISSTAAPHTILEKTMVSQAMAARPQRPLLIIDIALPRDVEPDVNNLPGIDLYNLDQLENQIAANLKIRQREIPKVEAIINQELEAFLRWLHSLDVVPTITTFRKQFEMVRQQELARTLNRLNNLEEHEQKIITELSHRLVNKFLHQPTVRLRVEAAQGNGIIFTNALQELFSLEVDH